jgi:hypothetical protein
MATVLPGVYERIIQPFYDTMLYPAAGAGAAPFVLFQKPKGAGLTAFGAGVGVGANTIRDTNMSVPGQLPAGFSLEVHAIAVMPAAETPPLVVDMFKLLVGGVLIFNVGTKVQLTLPILKLGSGGGVSGFAATAVGGAPLEERSLGNGVADPRAVYSYGDTPVTIPSQINFDVTLQWPSSGIAITTAMPITVYLEGILSRPVQ